MLRELRTLQTRKKQSKGVLSFEKPFKCLSSHAVLDTEVPKICQIAWPLVPWVHLSNIRIISPGLSASGKLKDKIRLGMWLLFECSCLSLGTSWQVCSPTLLSDLSALMGITVSKLGLFVLLLTQSGPSPHYTLWRLLPDSLL